MYLPLIKLNKLFRTYSHKEWNYQTFCSFILTLLRCSHSVVVAIILLWRGIMTTNDSHMCSCIHLTVWHSVRSNISHLHMNMCVYGWQKRQPQMLEFQVPIGQELSLDHSQWAAVNPFEHFLDGLETSLFLSIYFQPAWLLPEFLLS